MQLCISGTISRDRTVAIVTGDMYSPLIPPIPCLRPVVVDNAISDYFSGMPSVSQSIIVSVSWVLV